VFAQGAISFTDKWATPSGNKIVLLCVQSELIITQGSVLRSCGRAASSETLNELTF
jgi:hypothetical protein